MKKIALTKGYFALVDDDDFEWLNKWKWHAVPRQNTCYAYSKRGRAMHREILNLNDPKIYADHKDGDGLNNQRSNLRTATPAQNAANRRSYKNSTSKYLGVSWGPGSNTWVARIGHNGKYKFLGCFKKEEEAAIAFNEAAREIHGEFANLNKIEL